MSTCLLADVHCESSTSGTNLLLLSSLYFPAATLFIFNLISFLISFRDLSLLCYLTVLFLFISMSLSTKRKETKRWREKQNGGNLNVDVSRLFGGKIFTILPFLLEEQIQIHSNL